MHSSLDQDDCGPNHGLIVRRANRLSNLLEAAIYLLAIMFQKESLESCRLCFLRRLERRPAQQEIAGYG